MNTCYEAYSAKQVKLHLEKGRPVFRASDQSVMRLALCYPTLRPVEYKHDALLTVALDRLLRHAETVVIEGKSFRMKDNNTDS